MAIEANAQAYFQSISAELASKAERIRNLIGDSHFLSDGHHKEYLLQSVLERFLPAGFICSRGFVVRDNDLQMRSTEQDLLVIDTRMHAPLFRESGVTVTFPENVRAAISVKSTLSYAELDDSLAGLDSIPTVVSGAPLWRGVFGFRLQPTWAETPPNLVRWLNSVPNGGDKPRLATWQHGAIACEGVFITVDSGSDGQEIRAFATDLSAALFIAQITDHLAAGATKGQSSGVNELLAHLDFPRIAPAP